MDTLVDRYNLAIRFGKHYGLGDEAEDFAGWCMERWLRGVGVNQHLKYSVIDYLRVTNGRTTSELGQLEYNEKKGSLQLEYEDEDGRREQTFVAPVEEPRPPITDITFFLKTPMEKRAYQLVYQDDVTLREAAVYLGVTESRVCQVLRGVEQAMQRAYVLDRVEDADFRVRIKWLSIE